MSSIYAFAAVYPGTCLSLCLSYLYDLLSCYPVSLAMGIIVSLYTQTIPTSIPNARKEEVYPTTPSSVYNAPSPWDSSSYTSVSDLFRGEAD
ncbi:hypothetical protein VTL71DRAFT_4870 [Oculimacula yallundae]|uniref:Uncharacterized protein n=1 Tax=Oculimacula yallundae TaxID=86028 RepID=A0ABR4C376_9HELO